MMRRAAVLTGLVVALVAGPAGPASANPKGGCPLGKLCLYTGRGYTGDRQDVDPQPGPCTAVATPVWSAVNRSGPRAGTARYRLRLYRDTVCRNQAATVAPEAGRENTGGSRSFVIEEVS